MQLAIEIYSGLRELSLSFENPEFNFWDDDWFPIAGFESSEYLYLDCNITPSPIVQWEMECTPSKKRTYTSLNAMFSVIAECCEMDVYQIVPDPYAENGEIMVKIDEEKRSLENEIFQKYNGDGRGESIVNGSVVSMMS